MNKIGLALNQIEEELTRLKELKRLSKSVIFTELVNKKITTLKTAKIMLENEEE